MWVTYLREARRFFRNNPLLNLSGIAILGVGIGASAIAVSLLYALASLTYPGMRSQGYATIAEESEGGGSVRISWSRIMDMRAAAHPLATISVYSETLGMTVRAHRETRSENAASVARGFFGTYTPPLSVGRDFSLDEENECSAHVVILSTLLAGSLFHSPSGALGQHLSIGGIPFQVVGVAPVGFRGIFGESTDLWVPPACLINLIGGASSSGDVWKWMANFYGVAASRVFSSANLAMHLSKLLPLHTPGYSLLHVSQGLTTDPVRDTKFRGGVRLGLFLALVFTLVSCLNYSLLLLARMPRHMQEAKLKKALGANSFRLALELTTGPACMAAASMLLASLLMSLALIQLPYWIGYYGNVVRGSNSAALVALALDFVLAAGVTLFVSLLPILFILHDDGIPRMGNTTTANRKTLLLLQLPVVMQMAFCACVLVLSGMIVTSFRSMLHQPLGYDPDQLAVVQCDMVAPGGITGGGSLGSFPSLAARQSVIARLRILPGVRGVSFSATAPLDAEAPPRAIEIQRINGGTGQAPHTVYWTTVSPGYFDVMGAKLVLGRDFEKIPENGGAQDIIVSRTVADEIWPKENPVGRSVRLIYPAAWGLPTKFVTVKVDGVVEDMRFSGFSGSPEPRVFFSSYQGPIFDTGPEFIVRGTASLRSLEEAARPIVRSLMPGVDVSSSYLVRQRLDAKLAPDRRRAEWGIAGALLMVLVSSIGFYGSLSYYVASMRRDMAVRICFGASRADISKIVVKRAAICTASAVALSLPAWVAMARLSSNEYLGRVAWSTPQSVCIVLVYILFSLLISVRPAAAAARVAPSEILKEQ